MSDQPTQKQHRILIVDDTADVRSMLSLSLKTEGYEILTADGGRTGIQAVDEKRPDLILLDIMMPDMSGELVCKNIRDNPWYDMIYIIIVTASAQKEAELLRLGADDFISKPFDMDALLARVRLGLGRVDEKANALLDTVTRLTYHNVFQRNLEIEITRAKRYRHNLSLILLSLDGFEEQVAGKGEETGKKILGEVADLLILRKSDAVTRIDSEFAILLLAVPTEDVVTKADRLRQQVAEHAFAGGIRLTASVSVVSLDHNENLLATAESYLVGMDGSNAIVVNGRPVEGQP